MIVSFVWLLVATVFVQVPNLLGIHDRQQDGVLDVWTAAKIALFTVPLTFIATTGFTLYYGRAEQHFSYPAMVIYAHVAALIIGIVIQVIILKSKETNILEVAGLGICVFGLVLSIYSKPLLAWFKEF